MSMPQWLRDKLANPPSAGTGVHPWLFSVARQLHAHWTPDAITAALRVATERCGRHVSDREIRDAVRNSHAVAWVKGGEKREYRPGADSRTVRPAAEGAASTPFPRPCPARREAALASGSKEVASLDCLRWQAMNLGGIDFLGPTWRPAVLDAGDWLDLLFPGAEWLCLSRADLSTAQTRRRQKWAFREHEFTYVVPSPMTAAHGAGLDGRTTSRCLDNTGPRRWLVIEFDDGTADEQAALHWFLDASAAAAGWPRLRLALHSGGKSLHGWYGPVTDEAAARELFAYARLTARADLHTWPRCQLVRLPEGINANGNRQAVHFHLPSDHEIQNLHTIPTAA
jgi:hypothetical protein